MTRKYGWSKDTLIHNITIKIFEKFLLNQTNFETQFPEVYKRQAGMAIKNEYMFTFIGNQYKIVVNGDEFFIDLLLYHRKLRSMVAVELKIGKLEPADVGQLRFYLTALDEQEKLPEENSSIGIIICCSKNRTVKCLWLYVRMHYFIIIHAYLI